MNKVIDIFSDGSFTNGKAKWAFVAVLNDKILHKAKGEITCTETCKMFQIGGEMAGVMEGIKWAKKNGYKVVCKIDYLGLKEWLADLFDQNKKPWKTNKQYTKDYRAFCLENREIIVDMVKIKSHSSDYWNDYVDAMMK